MTEGNKRDERKTWLWVTGDVEPFQGAPDGSVGSKASTKKPREEISAE